MSDVEKVEQRLQDPPQFYVLPADDALAALIPMVLGMVTRNLIPGIIIGVLAYFIWKRVKADRGISGIMAWVYWCFPAAISPFRTFPDSAVSDWRA